MCQRWEEKNLPELPKNAAPAHSGCKHYADSVFIACSDMSETFHVTIKQMYITGPHSAVKELLVRTINIVCTELAAP